jgi:LEA14-like dessication related protein
MRIVKRRLPALLLVVLVLAASSCRPLIREVFKSPKVKLVDVGISGNPFLTAQAPIEAVLHLSVNNPNTYALTVSEVAYAATIGSQCVASGQKNETVRIEPSGDTIVKVPVQLRPDAFAAALREVLQERTVSYEFNGSVGVVAPVVGVVRIPFSKTGRIDPMDLLRRKGIGFN